MTASSFIPKPEDHRLVCKRPHGEMRRFKVFGRGREVPGVRGTGWKVGGQRVFWEWEGPHYLPATLAAPLLSPESGSRHVVHGGL